MIRIVRLLVYLYPVCLEVCAQVDVYGFTHSGGADHYYDHKGYEKGMRKPWQMKHHWTIERFAFNQLRDGALPNVKVH